MKQRVDSSDFSNRAPSGVDELDIQNPNPRKRKRADLKYDDHNDDRLNEYLEVMQPPSKSKIWANEDSPKVKAGTVHISNPPQSLDESQQNEEYEHVSNKTENLPIVQDIDESLRESGASATNTNGFTNPAPLVEENTRLPQSRAPPPSDEDWLRSRTSRLLGLVEADDTSVIRDEEKLAAGRPSIPQKLLIENVSRREADPKDDARAACRLFVRNLPYTATEEELKRHFDSNGRVSLVEVRRSPISPEPLFFSIW